MNVAEKSIAAHRRAKIPTHERRHQTASPAVVTQQIPRRINPRKASSSQIRGDHRITTPPTTKVHEACDHIRRGRSASMA